MKRLVLTLAFVAMFLGAAKAQVQQLVDFNNTSNLTTLFNPDSSPEFTNIADQGIGNTGSIDVPLGSQDIWTTKAGYSVSGEGDVYTLSAFFKIKENDGYGGLGFSPDAANEPDPLGSPVFGLGMAFHGGGGMFVNNQVLTDVSWPPDLVLGNWYKMILKVTAMGSNTYDMDFQIWNSDANGTLGTMKTEQVLNGVVNTEVGTASILHVYFSAAGSRMEKIDNFYINLEGGAVIVEPGAPVVLTNGVSAILTSSATCGGNVTDDQGSAVTARGVCWSTTTGPTIALSTKTSDGTGTGTFVSSVTGLTPNTTYYVRAFATNGVGTSYGAEVNFTTQAVASAVVPAGSGTSLDPYMIASLDNLLWIGQNSSAWGAYYKQTADIDASQTLEWNSGQGWSPIGNSTTNFTGSYDGQGHTISGLYINRLVSGIGLFGVSTGSFSNLGVINLNISGGHNTGGLVGQGGNISNCYTTGTVNGYQYVGGLAGSGTNVSKCYSTCNVLSSASAGGLVGYGSGTIRNCYSTGSVTRRPAYGTTDLGGFVGWDAGATIQYCYSTGSVTYAGAASPTTNGFVGTNFGGSFTANFFDQTTSEQTSGTGATAELTDAMKTRTTFLSAGWDQTIWNMDAEINSGYPYLQWQNPGGTPLPIQLASFTGRANPHGRGTLLEWITLSEINNYGFEVQRSADSTHYQSIPGTFIPGHGTTNEPQHYSFTDSTVAAGAWYYRLKQIDLDGSVHYSEGVHVNAVTDVKEAEVPTVFSLSQNYPNPFNPSSTIQYGLPQNAFVKLTVYNAIGQQVAQLVNEQQQAGYHNVVFRADGLASGMYLYKIQAGSFSNVRKLMLLK